MLPAIRVENLSKLYQIGRAQAGEYRTLRESLTSAAAAPFRRLRRLRSSAEEEQPDTIWALKDVSFDVQPGEVVGIIGRNGAGKSTLLKILSRITEPTHGRATIRGRIASLLEVGTGFHHELTGRENIYLNGTILGMRRREIEKRFDDIVEFGEIEQFLDTPVKRYSSGMYVRLAFAVAAHLEPEILIVDEVLAVGDSAFQRKCLGKMNELSHGGRTVLFVSHNMPAVQSLCRRAIVLQKGTVHVDSEPTSAVSAYYHSLGSATTGGEPLFRPDDLTRTHLAGFRIEDFRITSLGESSHMGVPIGAPLEFNVKCSSEQPLQDPIIVISVAKHSGIRVTTFHSMRSGARFPERIQGTFGITCSTSDLRLPRGKYTVGIGVKAGGGWVVNFVQVASLTILDSDFFGTGKNPDSGDDCVVCRQEWHFED